jgi:hypothetical protein
MTPHQLAHDPAQRGALQQALLKDDCYLLGTRNEDPLDLARQASVTASAELDCHAGSNVLSGVTREVDGESHQWAAPLGSDGGSGTGGTSDNGTAWLQLDWPAPVTLSEVRLVFDTGFARPLTLTMSDHHTGKTIRAPQPETVRDYTLEARQDGGWRELARETGNYQRLRVHHLQPLQTQSLRLRVTATNGDPAARLFELRTYA